MLESNERRNDDPAEPPSSNASRSLELQPPRSGKNLSARWLARHRNDRIVLYVVRGVFFLAMAGLGVSVWRGHFPEHAVEPIVGACVVALLLIAAEIFSPKPTMQTLGGIAVGLFVGWILARATEPVIDVIITGPLGGVQPAELKGLCNLVLTTVYSYFAVSVLLQTRDDFKFILPYVEFRRDVRGHVPLLLDTSTIIDGRVAGLLQAGILDQKLIVPRFVLNELQNVADSADRAKRQRGRRGMDVLYDIMAKRSVDILERDLSRDADVDRELIAAAESTGAKLLTTDFNLQKRARLQGVPVVNVNDLATALKPVVVPGESLRVKLLREGESPGQAVGFLEDGTMVVVEQASRRIGREVNVDVTSSTQTSAGKMVFGRVRRSSGGPRRGRRAQEAEG